MTNGEVLPSGQPQAGNGDLVLPAAIAGITISALLAATVALLWVSGISVAAWAAFAVGVWFGLCATVAAVLIGGRK